MVKGERSKANGEKGEIKVFYCNVNGWSDTIKQELNDITQQHKDVAVIIAAEMKTAQGADTRGMELKGYTGQFYLRESVSGGIGVWTSDSIGINLEVWPGLKNNLKPSIESERVWILIETNNVQLAVCGMYVRPNKSKKDEANSWNEALLQQVEKECIHIQKEGYRSMILGDMNAHVRKSSTFDFTENLHQENLNGRMLAQMSSNCQLQCINPMKWSAGVQSHFTYERDLGTRYVKSVIDYCMVDMSGLEIIKDFVVDMRDEYCLYTDHASLVVTLDVSDIPLEYADLNTKNYKKHNWTAFNKKVEEVVKHHNRRFCLSTVNEQARLVTDVIIKSANSTSSQMTIKKESKKVREHRKTLKRTLRERRVQQKQVQGVK